MKVTLVHPGDPENKVVLDNDIQVTAYKGQGFVEESVFAAEKVAATTAAEDAKGIDEVRTELEKAQAKLATEKSARKEAEKAQKEAEGEAEKYKADAEAAMKTAEEAEKAKASAEARVKELETK